MSLIELERGQEVHQEWVIDKGRPWSFTECRVHRVDEVRCEAGFAYMTPLPRKPGSADRPIYEDELGDWHPASECPRGEA